MNQVTELLLPERNVGFIAGLSGGEIGELYETRHLQASPTLDRLTVSPRRQPGHPCAGGIPGNMDDTPKDRQTSKLMQRETNGRSERGGGLVASTRSQADDRRPSSTTQSLHMFEEGGSICIFMQPKSEATSFNSYPKGTTPRWQFNRRLAWAAPPCGPPLRRAWPFPSPNDLWISISTRCGSRTSEE